MCYSQVCFLRRTMGWPADQVHRSHYKQLKKGANEATKTLKWVSYCPGEASLIIFCSRGICECVN
jgi:hypothetical protein